MQDLRQTASRDLESNVDSKYSLKATTYRECLSKPYRRFSFQKVPRRRISMREKLVTRLFVDYFLSTTSAFFLVFNSILVIICLVYKSDHVIGFRVMDNI